MSKLYDTYINDVLRLAQRKDKGQVEITTLLLEEETKEHVIGLEIQNNLAESKDAKIHKDDIVYAVADKHIDHAIEDVVEKKRRYCGKSQAIIGHVLERLQHAKAKKKSKLSIGQVDKAAISTEGDLSI